MTHPDFRAELQMLTDSIDEYSRDPQANTELLRAYDLFADLKRARAALAAPQQGAPSDDELRGIFYQHSDSGDDGPAWIESEQFIVAVRDALAAYDRWGMSRCERLQQEQQRFRDPERTILCDILANGTLLPDPQGTRYGAQAVPVAVAERLPGEGDKNEDGEVWVEEPAYDYPIADTGDYDIEPGKWILRRILPYDAHSNRRWLPHWALPLPEAQP